MASTIPTTAMPTTGMGILNFPDEETVHLKPILLSKRQEWRKSHPLWSTCVPVSPMLLWLAGLSLLLHPVGVVLLRKYREDFQSEWHAKLVKEDSVLKSAAVVVLDGLVVWVIDSSPQLASAFVFLYLALCMGYLAYAQAKGDGHSGGKSIKQD